ncbi:MAG: 4-hydroxy-tetrahydrodipicolinate synthase [Akkermansiaceae bacterium]|nr:4-hydroxy-tetrahydrodipicolinate synthase [Akkermansiaceae bacterium]
MFAGTHTAIITPFRDGQVDVKALKALIDRQADAGIDGIVPVGTTGESPTLDTAEHLAVIKHAVEFAAGRLKVIAGTGANATHEAIELTSEAERLGADATLQVCPYYNKPSQEGLYRHFKAVADATSLPVMLYSIPGRSVVEIAIETTVRLASDCRNIKAIKEAGGSVDRVNQLVQAVPDGFEILSGDDPLTLPFLACGATGLVSVAANLVPDVMARLVRACLNGSFDEALELQKNYYPLFSALMTIDTNPVPIKGALALTGQCTDEIRLPLVALTPEKVERLRTVLTDYELL